MEREKRLIGIQLPELARFSEFTGVEPGESFDGALARTNHLVVCFTSSANVDIARAYESVVGKNLKIVPVSNPISEASSVDASDVIPLVLHSATDPVLNERMFADGPKFGQLLMGHIYVPIQGHESPALYAIGTTNQGLKNLSEFNEQTDEQLLQQMEERRRRILGDSLGNNDFRQILQSSSVRRVIAHALGPVGTNISQAMGEYIQALGIGNKTEITVHPAGIEPLKYAEMARNQVEDGTIPIHMECAVYYAMAQLFEQRTGEVVFADHHYMPLDAMQLASAKTIEELAMRGKIRIATHPSPKPLIESWINSGHAEWIKATSNSAAAQMALTGEVDACVTTESGLKEAPGLVSRHVFGSPSMLFTIGTPLNQSQLRRYI